MQKKLVSSLRPSDVTKLLPRNYSPSVAYVLASAAITTVNTYIASADEQMDLQHTVNCPKSNYFTPSDILTAAIALWGKMVDLKDPLGMVHDGYFKLWQLSRPSFAKYDILLLDEAQDTTPCLIDVIKRQNMKKVMVGDRHQAIYQFRGACNAMSSFNPDLILPLSTSYRFGKKIAYLANMLLYVFKGENTTINGFKPEDQIGDVDKTKPYAVISKTNIGLFDQAVDAVQNKQSIHYVGGIAGYGLDLILDVHFLKTSQAFLVRDQFIRTFSTFGQFQLYAEESEDVQCLNLIKIVERYGNHIPTLISKIKDANVSSENAIQISNDIEHIFNASVFLSTAHKSKGLEFNQVILSDDFTPLVEGDNYVDVRDISEQDINLLYVALTRAKHTLQINQQLKDFIVTFKMKRNQQNLATINC